MLNDIEQVISDNLSLRKTHQLLKTQYETLVK